MPEAAVVALLIDGFWTDEVKLFGPVQLYVAPATDGVDNVNTCPAQIGPLLEALGVDGVATTVTVLVQVLVQPVLPVIVRVNVNEPAPSASTVTVCELASPLIAPLPLIDQLYALMAAGPEKEIPVVPEHTVFVPLMEHVGLALTVAVVAPAEEQPPTVTVRL